LKTHKVPRILTALDVPEKSDYLSVIFCLIANRVLPEDGGRRSWLSPKTHDELALAMGLDSRVTFTKRLSYLRGEARDSAGRLKPFGEICPLAQEEEFPSRRNASAPMIESRRRWAMPNEYSVGLPEKKVEFVVYRKSTNKAVPRARFSGSNNDEETRARVHKAAMDQAVKLNERLGRIDYEVRESKLDPDNFYYPTAHDIIADKLLSPFFNHAYLFKENGELDFSGTFDLPEWVWHPALGVSDTARLVLTYYIAAGLITDKGMDGKPKGWIQPKQRTVARRLGISTKTVHKADRELEAIGIIRVIGTVSSREAVTAEMKWAQEKLAKQATDRDPRERWRKENVILFLPIRTMTDVEILAERRRMMLARRAMHEQRKMHRAWLRDLQLEDAQLKDLAAKRFALALQVCRATRLHRKAVKACKGQKARVTAIWAAVQQELLSAGIERRIISALIPTILSPPHPLTQAEAAQIGEMIERSFKNSAWST
jgi:DNA-binding Lrp family transcriptional regulator